MDKEYKYNLIKERVDREDYRIGWKERTTMGAKTLSDIDKPIISKDHFIAFESVRRYGKWNMYDPTAKKATGLEEGIYLEIIENYQKYEKEYRDSTTDEIYNAWINNAHL
tara:strand:+ start:422 stop:751 length:330 start_codon:yes stop_codon:yes gene_type:complete